MNECEDSEVCLPGNNCTNEKGSYTCRCILGYTLQEDGSCIITEQDNSLALKIGIPLGLVGLLGVLAALYFLFYKRHIDLSTLPPDVRWFYERYQRYPSYFSKMGNLLTSMIALTRQALAILSITQKLWKKEQKRGRVWSPFSNCTVEGRD